MDLQDAIMLLTRVVDDFSLRTQHIKCVYHSVHIGGEDPEFILHDTPNKKEALFTGFSAATVFTVFCFHNPACHKEC